MQDKLTRTESFGFGLEAEFLLLNKWTNRPLFHQDLSFEQLLNATDAIAVPDFTSNGFNVKPLHRLPNPYLIEGYYLTDAEMREKTLLPKGVEVRTPLVNSIEQATEDLWILHNRLAMAMDTLGYKTAIISHHPVESNFDAPPNYRRHDYWQWALTAMLTFGPDINISLPPALGTKIDQAALHEKINYYMPALIALSLASPLIGGDLWRIRGKAGKSIRTYKRSLWAPLYYIHHKPSLRFEFKGFEMARNLPDYKAYFLVCLALLLDRSLTGRASDPTRLYDLGQVAVHGVELDFVQERAKTVLTSAQKVAAKYGFDAAPLQILWDRLDSKRLPADEIMEIFARTGSIGETMAALSLQNPAKCSAHAGGEAARLCLV